jgi:hypothetical protein
VYGKSVCRREFETFVKRIMRARRPFALGGLAALPLFIATATLTPTASALDNDATTREASRHFQRGVSLYREADYRGALVEFQRASELVPAPVTFYNIGETDFQLRDYSGALTAFERYLSESSPDEHHRAEVEASVELLRTRIGHLLVTTTPPAADITIDDQAIGKTPFEKPLRLSIGHHKVVATMAGRPPVQRYVDVAAEDDVTVSLSLAEPEQATAPLQEGRPTPAMAHVDTQPGRGSPLRVVGWVSAGALAAGGAVFGVLANAKSNDLQQARDQYPVTRAVLNHDAAVTTTYAVLTDSLIGAALIVGGITLVSTLSASSGPKVTVGVSSVRFETSF